MSDFHHRIQNINRRKNSSFMNSYGDDSWLNYIIEAMRPINSESTQKAISYASYLEELLNAELKVKNISVEFIQIGGTSLNTNIATTDKVDLLMVFNGYLPNNENQNKLDINIQELIVLKDLTKKILLKAFPEVLLDDSQPLALEMSIQSWLCNFCLYFGFWQQNRAYASGIYSNTFTQILNKDTFSLESSNSILALHNLNRKDENSNSNAKVLIRVLKNLKADSEESITLTGYQITSIVYSMDDYALAKPNGQILFLLLECSLFLKRLIDDPFMRRSLKSPENNTVMDKMNEESFVHGCNNLKNELDKIIKHLVLEIDLYTSVKDINQTQLIPDNIHT